MTTKNLIKHRDVTVDIVRSLAIVFMVGANMAVIAQGQPPGLFRVVSSMAAPIFVSLACMMVVLGSNKNHHLPFVMMKCLFLIVVAVLLDISNEVIPLKNIDILYLIGLLLILSNLISRFSCTTLAITGLCILGITPFLQSYFGYHTTMAYELESSEVSNHFTAMLAALFRALPHRYLIDGWFPIFPWASLCFFSVIIAKIRYSGVTLQSFAKKPFVAASLALIFFGGLLWYLFPGEHVIRYQYIELFYPPMPGFMLFMMGVVMGLIALVDFIGDVSFFALIHPLGEASLFMYLFHLSIIHYVLTPMGLIHFDLRYFCYYLVFISSMILIGLLLRLARRIPGYKKAPYVVRWIFG